MEFQRALRWIWFKCLAVISVLFGLGRQPAERTAVRWGRVRKEAILSEKVAICLAHAEARGGSNTGIADKVMKRTRARERGTWVYTPKDFLDLGSRAAIDQALSRLTKSGDLRRVGRGLYDLPRTSGVLHRPAPVDRDSVVAALTRCDGVRIMPDGIAAANRLDLQMAWRFDLHCIDAQGQHAVPCLVHHTVLGSLECFIALLLGQCGGRLLLCGRHRWDERCVMHIATAFPPLSRSAQPRPPPAKPSWI